MRRRTLTLLALVGLLVMSVLWAITLGSVPIPLTTALSAFLDRLPWITADGWTPVQATILFHLRLPRILLAMLVGGGLALSGAVLQGLFRNPMADPGIIGVSSGGALGAVVAITSGLALVQSWALPFFAFLGSSAATFLIYRLATRHGRTPLATLLLAGLAVGAFLTAMTSFVLSLGQNIFILREMLFWLLGGLDGRGWSHLGLVSGPVLLGSVLLLAFSRDLNALALAGEEGAMSLGVELVRLKRRLLTLTALVTGVVVSVSGIIGFVGLIVPHLIRLLLGPDHRLLLPASFLGGAAFLVWADLLTRTLFPTEELRLGVVTAAVGAPFFLFLLHRQRWRTEAVS